MNTLISSAQLYRILHITGMILLFSSLGGVLLLLQCKKTPEPKAKKIAAMTHGIGLFLIIFSGFGMLETFQLSLVGQGWLFLKLAIWILLGGMVSFAYRSTKNSTLLWWLSPGLGVCAAILGILTPF